MVNQIETNGTNDEKKNWYIFMNLKSLKKGPLEYNLARLSKSLKKSNELAPKFE